MHKWYCNAITKACQVGTQALQEGWARNTASCVQKSYFCGVSSNTRHPSQAAACLAVRCMRQFSSSRLVSHAVTQLPYQAGKTAAQRPTISNILIHSRQICQQQTSAAKTQSTLQQNLCRHAMLGRNCAPLAHMSPAPVCHHVRASHVGASAARLHSQAASALKPQTPGE